MKFLPGKGGGETRTAAASRRLMMRSARMQIFCHCSMSELILLRTTLLVIVYISGQYPRTSPNYVRELIFEVTGDCHFLDPVNTLTGRFLFNREGRLFAPLLERRFCQEGRKKAILFDHGMIAIESVSLFPILETGQGVHYKVDESG